MTRIPYRLLYNQDSSDLFYIVKEPLTPAHVDHMVDEVADGEADVLLINPNAQRVNYPSRAWQTFWDGYAPGKREFFGPVPEDDIPAREHMVAQMQHLAESGCDYLARSLAHCRARGITPGVSVRMNDMHDVPWPGSHLFSHFYMAHPQWHLHNPPVSGWSATGLNYAVPEVRAHYLALIRELAEEYDIDVLELDFLRFTSYFPREDFAHHCAIMTTFIAEVRQVLDNTGRRIALLPRVAATPAAAYELGFDVAAWARERLIDGISAGAFFNTAWDVPVDRFRALVGDDVAIYACGEGRADQRPGLPTRFLPLDADLLRGFAAGYLAAGADGINIFNYFTVREGVDPHEPLFAMLRAMRSLDDLRGQPKTYILKSAVSAPEVDGPFQLPQTLSTNQPRAFHLWMAAEPSPIKVTAQLTFTSHTTPSADQLWLHVNDITVGPAWEIQREHTCVHDDCFTAHFIIPTTALRDGNNVLTIRNEGSEITAVGMDVRV